MRKNRGKTQIYTNGSIASRKHGLITTVKEQKYDSGEEIHIGDHVNYARFPGTIVFVIDRDEFSAEFPADNWSENGSGLMIRFETMALVMLKEADKLLEFVSRADAAS